jgi:hypothetical protein
MLWNHTYGDGWWNTESYAANTSDGGYVIAGTTSVPEGPGTTFLVRTSSDGTLLWQKTYEADWPDVKQTSDGGYVLAGDWTDPNTKLVQPLLVKIDDNGTEQWTKSSWENHPQGALYESAVQSQDGGYVFGALSPIIGQSDQVVEAFWIAKLASTPTYEVSPVFLYFAAISTVEGAVLIILAIALIRSAVSRRDRPAGH